jgi:hypothetical protein
MKSYRQRRQFESWLPRLLTSINRSRTRELIPQFASLSRSEKIDKAVSVFRRLADEEPGSEMRPSRRWSLEYFEACAEGAHARRQFLLEEGVFGDKKWLVTPERVQPQMEIGNLEPSAYSDTTGQEVSQLAKLMFHEYFGVKNLLSIPEPSDLMAWIASRVSFAKRVDLPPRA